MAAQHHQWMMLQPMATHQPMITIRPSTLEDAEELAKCMDAIALERRFLGRLGGFTVGQTRALISSLADNGGIQLIAVDENTGIIIGWCHVARVSMEEGMRHVCGLGMGVLKSYRRHGWGQKLLENVIQQVFSSSNTTFSRIEVEVWASNKAAIRLYEKNGFIVEGTKRRARLLDGVEDDMVIMGLLREEWRPYDHAVDGI